MKKTAVEWVLFELSKNGLLPDGIPSDIHNQAKEMEKEQIIEAYNTSFRLRDKPYSTADKYYNETFNQNKMKLLKTTPDFLPLEKFNFTDEQLIEMYDCVFDTTHSDGFKKSEIKDLLFNLDYQFMESRKENWEVNLKDKIVNFEYTIIKSE